MDNLLLQKGAIKIHEMPKNSRPFDEGKRANSLRGLAAPGEEKARENPGIKSKRRRQLCVIKATASDWQGSVRGMPYRVLAIRGDMTLHDLAMAVLKGFNFDFDHCFGFYDNVRKWTNSLEKYEQSGGIGEGSRNGSVEKAIISDVFAEPGKRMLFLFDYGDEWHFILRLKALAIPEKGAEYPKVIESRGKAPEQYR